MHCKLLRLRYPATLLDRLVPSTLCCHGNVLGVHQTRWVQTMLSEENKYEKLAESATPLWKRTYEHQLQIKQHYMSKAMVKLVNIIKNKCRRRLAQELPLLSAQIEANDGQVCPLREIRPSPVIYGYRNKDEQNFGKDFHGKLIAGQNFIDHTGTNRVCIPNYESIITNSKHKSICKGMETFLAQSRIPHLVGDGNAHFILMILRTTRTNETMMCLTISPCSDIPDLCEIAKSELREFFMDGLGRDLGVTSIYLQESSYYHSSATPYQHICGTPHITELLSQLRFRISPDSFFQVNTDGAEVLYETVEEVAGVGKETTILDVCCGTGTIGMVLAKGANRVIGIELSQQAVDDAKHNATLNGIQNVEYHCGKVSKVMKQFLHDGTLQDDMDLVAVVNPGRSGINWKMVGRLRACLAIKRLVYVTCKANGNVLRNMAELCYPESDAHPGPPFMPTIATPVDMFPQTRHTELVVRFDR